MTIYQKEAERHRDILGDVKAEELGAPLAVTLAKEKAEKLDKTNSCTAEEGVANRLGNTSAMYRPRYWSIRYLPV